MLRKTITRACGFLALLSCTALAQDRVVMHNGDVITGNISLITDDEILIEPSYADEFAIDIAEVATVEVEEFFEVEMGDKTELEARLRSTTPASRCCSLLMG